MIPDTLPYNLPDADLFNKSEDGFVLWHPDRNYIVLGISNQPETSLVSSNVTADNIFVTRRPTGGEAVMLTPGTIVITVARSFSEMIPFRDFFGAVNKIIIEVLEGEGVRGLALKGISDISIGDRKILGSSMKNSRNRLVYHSVLNIGEDPALFGRYLLHPRREPDYRKGRSHSDFVTSLREEGYNLQVAEVIEKLSTKIRIYLGKGIEPIP